MADKHSSNVIPFGARESHVSTDAQSDGTAILAGCRDRLVQGVSTLFVQRAKRAADEFLLLADRSRTTEQQQDCFTAVNLLSNRMAQLVRMFHGAFSSKFDSHLRDLSGSRARGGIRMPDELSLVDTDDFEQDLAITKLSARAALNCSQHLVALDRRLAVLLRQQRITQDDNPLHPTNLFDAMLQAASGMDVGRQLALALVHSFERQVAGELPGIYAEINRYLIECGILPTIPLSDPQSPQIGGYGPGGGPRGYGGVPGGGEPAMTGHGPGGYPQGAGAMAGMAPPMGTQPLGGGDVFGELLRALQGVGGGHQAQTGWQGAGPTGALAGMPGPFDAFGTHQNETLSLDRLVAALGDLQRGNADPRLMPGLGAVQIDPAQGNVLRQIRSTPMANWSRPVDAMTIDIVAMLFDAIFNDPDLPASMKAEIAKLQIPVLKVALLDKAFFSDPRHPARRLLDLIAKSGIGRGEDDESRLAEKICQIVQSVVQGFDSDVQIFSTLADGLESFLAEEEQSVQVKAVDMAEELKIRERKEIAAACVAAEVDRRINHSKIPVLISDFISNHWRLVLVDVFVRGGDVDVDWAEALRLMDELIWSVEPKSGSAERDRLLALLPNLIKRLRAGIERLGRGKSWDAFLGELIRLHMAALHNDMPEDIRCQVGVNRTQKPAEVTEPASEATQPVAAPAMRASAPAVPSPAVPAEVGVAEEPVDEVARLVGALEVGAWVEFTSARGNRNTLRLNWVSEFKRVYLFTNRQGENAMTLAVNSLTDHLRNGTARLLSQNPLTDRAVSQVLGRIKPASGQPASGSHPRGYAWE